MSTETKHACTPGPWEVYPQDPESSSAMVEGPIVRGPEGQLVAEVLSADLSEDPAEMFATGDAALIGAAPDLLAACRIAAEALRALRGHADDTTADILFAAIAKAEGVQP